MSRLLAYFLVAQGAYYLFTGAWALLDIQSFMAVTGPKTDTWLVKAMSCLFCAIGVALILARKQKSSFALSLITSFSMAVVDFYYSSIDVIWDVYKIDGTVQALFFILVILCVRTK